MPLFTYKNRPEDFVVTEILAEEPIGKGDFHYILLEKKGLTTFLLIDLMINAFGLNRNMIGIAGLKDKHAITRQWISISRRDVVKYCGGVNTLLDWLRRKGKIVKATYHTHLLKLGDNAGNHFEITLIPEKGITPEQKQTVDYCLKEIAAKGIPNYFGEQRFGFGGDNWKKGFALLSGQTRSIPGDKNTLQEKKFKIQAFASYVFNKYIEMRTERGLLYKQIPGDVRRKGEEAITGPIPGDDLLNATGEAGKLEQEVFAKCGLTADIMRRFKTYNLYGLRRPIVVNVGDLSYIWRGKALYLSFDLPSGSYATNVIETLEKAILKR